MPVIKSLESVEVPVGDTKEDKMLERLYTILRDDGMKFYMLVLKDEKSERPGHEAMAVRVLRGNLSQKDLALALAGIVSRKDRDAQFLKVAMKTALLFLDGSVIQRVLSTAIIPFLIGIFGTLLLQHFN